jgi:hypothetical protein
MPLDSIIAAVLIFILLSLAFGNFRNLSLVLINVPFALVGGVIAAWLGSGYLSLGSIVGFVTLFGITMRNSIMMILHFEHPRPAEENTIKNFHALCLLAVTITVSTETALARSASSPKADRLQSRATEVGQNAAGQVTVPEDVLNRLIGQCERHFRHAAKRFAKGDNPGAASQIRVGLALLSLEAGREHAETQNALRSSADELDRLAGRVEHGDVSSRNELNVAFAHADLALAAHYRAMADEAIANKEHDNAGRWLKAAADSVDDAVCWTGQKPPTAQAEAWDQVHALETKIRSGTNWTYGEAKKGVGYLGTQIQYLGSQMQKLGSSPTPSNTGQ